ncbi:hypothetical protein [Kitasatospora sp. NPDC057223]|uniref:hypothetical protein n=1 Tax=Kitasatospora sp. NPDC057223 TaxID=3346055 RepID=UPI003626E1DA
MFSTMKTRTAVGCTAAALAAIGVLAGTPAGAVSAGPAASPSDTPPIGHPVRATPAETQVGAFFEEYRLAVLGEIDDLPGDVRLKYLSHFLDVRLTSWAAQQRQVDPVFRARVIPTSWSVREVAQELGFASVRLTEYWSDGSTQDVWYTVRPGDRQIVDLDDAPPF